MINEYFNWVYVNYQWIINTLLTIFIGYHIYFLSKKTTNKDLLIHKEKIQGILNNHLHEIHSKNLRRRVYLINIKNYFTKYPDNHVSVLGQYSHIKAEIKALRFDGVEFFESMPQVLFQKKDGKLSFSGTKDEKLYNIFPVGVIPYEWIEFIDLEGDDCNSSPLIFCYFKGLRWWKFGYSLKNISFPYKELRYYKKNENFQKNDPFDFEFSLIREKIYK